MLSMRNCKGCGKLYLSNNLTIKCSLCEKSDDREFNKIKNYLLAHPRANIFEVATNLSIKIDTIRMYLQQNRLEIIESNNKFLSCEKCKCSIKSGILCDHCFRFSDDKSSAFKYTAENTLHNERSTQTDNSGEIKLKFLSSPLAKSRKLAVR